MLDNLVVIYQEDSVWQLIWGFSFMSYAKDIETAYETETIAIVLHGSDIKTA